MINRIKSFHGLNKKSIEKYLKEKANNGLLLVSSSNVFLKFEKAVPKDINYYAYPIYKHKPFTYGTEYPDDSICKKMNESGYAYVTSNSSYHIFSTENLSNKPDIDEDDLGRDTLSLLLKTDLLTVFLLLIIFLTSGSKYSHYFPSFSNISVLNQMSLISVSMKILLISVVSVKLLYDLVWIIVNIIRKKSVWYPSTLAIKVKDVLIVIFTILGAISLLSGFFYDDQYWKFSIILIVFGSIIVSFRLLVNKFRTSKRNNIIIFAILIIVLSTGIPYLTANMFDKGDDIQETTLLDLNHFGYSNLEYEYQQKGMSIFVSYYEYYYARGREEEVLSLHVKCINKKVVNYVVNELIKEYDLNENTIVDVGILNSYLRYRDSEYAILVRDNNIYFLSGDVDVTNKEHQLIIKNELIQ